MEVGGAAYLGFLMVESRPYGSHYLTEALQIFPHILELDSLLLFQKLHTEEEDNEDTPTLGIQGNKQG